MDSSVRWVDARRLRAGWGLAVNALDGFRCLPDSSPSVPDMRASSVRIIASFGLLLALAASAHWIGGGPDPAATSHQASTAVSTQRAQR